MSSNNLCFDVIIEIAKQSDVITFFAFASACKYLRKLLLRYYNNIPIVKLSSIHELFINIIPSNAIIHRNIDLNTILMWPDAAVGQLKRLHDEDYGVWCVVKDQLQYNRNHQLVKVGVDNIYTVLRCSNCNLLSANTMFYPVLINNRIESVISCCGCISKLEAEYKGLLVDYIKANNITNKHIVHHNHANMGHCVYRRRYHNDNEFSVLNDSEVFAKIIIDANMLPHTFNIFDV